MDIVALIILGLWVLFWIYWLASAVGVKAGRARWGSFAGFRVAALVIVLLLLRGHFFKGHAVTTDHVLQGIGLAVFIIGLALAVWARLYIGRNWGTPMSR
jgi:protein-S-isoprenylcysteine O-methyltransferase Ste14